MELLWCSDGYGLFRLVTFRTGDAAPTTLIDERGRGDDVPIRALAVATRPMDGVLVAGVLDRVSFTGHDKDSIQWFRRTGSFWSKSESVPIDTRVYSSTTDRDFLVWPEQQADDYTVSFRTNKGTVLQHLRLRGR